MKLIFCPKCKDIFKLWIKRKRVCRCGESWGKYDNEKGINATIGGKAVPVGFANFSFVEALNNRPMSGLGKRFEAFVIPVYSPTIKVKVKEKKKRS